MIRYLGFFSLLFLMCSCSKNTKDVDVSESVVSVDMRRLDLEMSQCNSAEEVETVLARHPALVSSFVQYGIMPNLKVMSFEFLKLISSGQELFSAVSNELSEVDDIELELEDAFKHFKHYDNNFKEPVLYWIISGYGGFSVDAKDSTVVIIGSEYFLDDKVKFFPRREEMPYYLYKYYDRDHLSSKVVKRLVKGLYAEVNQKDQSLINSMIYWGKVLYMTEHILPNIPDSILVEYTADEILRVEANRKETYFHFVENQLFYKEDQNSKLKYVDRRPNTNELGDKAPGRIGQYLGWDIVRSYMKHNDVSLMELMSDTDHRQIFEKAKYKP